jgi:hypothetical protein
VQLSDACHVAKLVPIDNAIFNHEALLFPFVKIGLLNQFSIGQGPQRVVFGCLDNSTKVVVLVDGLSPVLVHQL